MAKSLGVKSNFSTSASTQTQFYVTSFIIFATHKSGSNLTEATKILSYQHSFNMIYTVLLLGGFIVTSIAQSTRNILVNASEIVGTLKNLQGKYSLLNPLITTLSENDTNVGINQASTAPIAVRRILKPKDLEPEWLPHILRTLNELTILTAYSTPGEWSQDTFYNKDPAIGALFPDYAIKHVLICALTNLQSLPMMEQSLTRSHNRQFS